MRDDLPIRPDELAALFGRWEPVSSAATALAVSGGSDSTALMVLFADWLRQSGQEAGLPTVLTVDHRLRPESAREARAVAAAAAALGFRHATLVWDGPKPQTGIQAAARTARYRLIADYMRVNDIALLLTGHTRDDQAETLLMRLARGSGLDGLAGMAPRLCFSDLGIGNPASAGPEIVRPLLEVAKARLRRTLEERGIAWIEDPSNQSPEFERPRLRAASAALHALGLTDAMLALSAARLARARRAIDQAVDQFCSSDAGAVSVDQCGYVTIDRARLQAAEEEIALRVLARVVAAAGGSDEPVPLGKLEAMAASVRGTGAESAKWTLARAMITANDRTVAVEREPGREPLPQLELQPGAQACWDGRFWVEASAYAAPGAVPGAVEVRALGEAAARELRQQGALPTGVPMRAMGLVPSFWRAGRLVAVPSLGFWSPPHRSDGFQSRFVWNEKASSGAGSRAARGLHKA
jgi:tRNA(Ile)-lysidine synthase